jgi:hypothetical protein
MSVHHEARAKVRSSDEEVPLTHGRGVCGSGNRSHSHPARAKKNLRNLIMMLA